MKTTILILAAMLAQASGWKLASVSDVERRYLAEKQPPPTAEGYALAWERDVTRDDTPEGRAEIRANVERLSGAVEKAKAEGYHHILALKEYDCAHERARFVRVLFKDARDAPIYEMSREEVKAEHLDEWANPTPATVNEKVLKTVCRDAQLRPGESQ